MSSDAKLKAMKLFPRNLTAHADVVVRGNPVTTRPESGVENSWPGLEFDHRNLDKVFFKGLYFEFHDERGAILRDFDKNSAAAKFFKKTEIAEGIYLAYIQGLVTSGREKSVREQRVFSFIPPGALENWRLVRDLEKGPVGLALCRRKVYDEVLANQITIDDVTPLFEKHENRHDPMGFFLLFGERTDYLNADGVIDPGLIPPGDLTRSMCSPWQFDFTDCGCFFWASNKPDMVSSPDQPQQILNWRRSDRTRDAERKATDWILKDGGDWEDTGTLGHVDLINHFQNLKFVFGGREADDYAPPKPLAGALLSRREVIERLKVLAPVEHALAVEYLYAYYSIKLPRGVGPQRDPWNAPGRPADQTPDDARVFTAASEVLTIAIDEMRHLRLVNEMLIKLGEKHVLGRANIIGIDFPEKKGFNQPFELQPLTAAQLDWFIKVEKASANHNDPSTIDGMYTLLLRSIEEGPEFMAAEIDFLAPSVKIIIDEGLDHFRRFSHASEALQGIPEKRYLHVNVGPKPAPKGSPEEILQRTADASYESLLRALDYVFNQKSHQHGALLEAARRAMYNLDDANRVLALKGYGALFTLPVVAPMAAVAAAATVTTTPREIGEPLRPHIEQLRNSGDAQMMALGERLDGKLADLIERIEAVKV